ncbi:MAG: hypothetical protein Q9178_003681 [Gyalolechia marmorata]
MTRRVFEDIRTDWSAKTLHDGLKQSIALELAKIVLANPEIHDLVFRVHTSPNGIGYAGDRSSIQNPIRRIWSKYQSNNLIYLVDALDREVLYPYYVRRSFDDWPGVIVGELQNGKFDHRPGAFVLKMFTDEACHLAWNIVAKEKQSKVEEPFNFMGLPGELRNMVYEYLFQGVEKSISVRAFRKFICAGGNHNHSDLLRGGGVAAVRRDFQVPRYDSKSRLHWDLYYAEFGNTVHRDQPKNICLAVLRANSLIHKEAEPILYKCHTFDFGVCPTAALAFYQVLPEAALPFIQRIRIDVYRAFFEGRRPFLPRITNEEEFSKTCNALVKLAPNIKLSTKLILGTCESNLDTTRRPFVRALARVQGIKSLRSEKGKKFASDFAALIRGADCSQPDQEGYSWKAIEYTVN